MTQMPQDNKGQREGGLEALGAGFKSSWDPEKMLRL